jgi:hypothetical protein
MEEVEAAVNTVNNFVQSQELNVQLHGSEFVSGMLFGTRTMFVTEQDELEVLKMLVKKAEQRIEELELRQ